MKKSCLINQGLEITPITEKGEKFMKRNEFIDILAEKFNMTKKQVAEFIDVYWETILTAVKKGDEVVFEYGKFVLKKKPEHDGRNPLTGATVHIAAKTVPAFKPSKKFKESVMA